jgi:hypothetical protein
LSTTKVVHHTINPNQWDIFKYQNIEQEKEVKKERESDYKSSIHVFARFKKLAIVKFHHWMLNPH